MIKKNRVKTLMQEGKCAVGTFVKITDPSTIELIGNAGFDFIAIDTEHVSMNPETVVNLIRAADLVDLVSIVRVRENNASQILRALDTGASGVMVPGTSSRAEVEDVVQRVKYAPRGSRGFANSQRAANYGQMAPHEYAASSNVHTIVVVYCETLGAIENMDEILEVEGLDVVFIGPFDLTQALGVIGQPSHPIVLNAIEKVLQKVRLAGKAAGIIAADAAEARELFRRGFQYVTISSDQGFIHAMGAAIVREAKTAL